MRRRQVAARARISAPSDRRTMRDRRNAAARRFDVGSRQISQQRHRVLNLVGVEKTQTLVDVGRHAAPLERRLEFAMALARPEQDARCPPAAPSRRTPVVSIAHRRAGRAAGRSRRPTRLGRRRDVLGGDEFPSGLAVGPTAQARSERPAAAGLLRRPEIDRARRTGTRRGAAGRSSSVARSRRTRR